LVVAYILGHPVFVCLC